MSQVREVKLYDERLGRLFEAGMTGMWLVDPNRVDLEDLINSWRPGAIVRVIADDVRTAIQFIPGGDDCLVGCIAGWISEQDE